MIELNPTTVPANTPQSFGLSDFFRAVSDKGGDVVDAYLNQKWGDDKQTGEVTDSGVVAAGVPNNQVNPPPMGYVGQAQEVFNSYRPIFIGVGLLLGAVVVYKAMS